MKSKKSFKIKNFMSCGKPWGIFCCVVRDWSLFFAILPQNLKTNETEMKSKCNLDDVWLFQNFQHFGYF